MVVNVFLEQNSDVLKSFGVFLVSMDIVRIEHRGDVEGWQGPPSGCSAAGQR